MSLGTILIIIFILSLLGAALGTNCWVTPRQASSVPWGKL